MEAPECSHACYLTDSPSVFVTDNGNRSPRNTKIAAIPYMVSWIAQVRNMTQVGWQNKTKAIHLLMNLIKSSEQNFGLSSEHSGATGTYFGRHQSLRWGEVRAWERGYTKSILHTLQMYQ